MKLQSVGIACILHAFACSSHPVAVAPAPLVAAGAFDASVAPTSQPAGTLAPAEGAAGVRIRKMLKQASRARQLPATREVPGLTLGRADLLARLRAHVDREVPQKAISDEGRLNAPLGLLPLGYDHENPMYAPP